MSARLKTGLTSVLVVPTTEMKRRTRCRTITLLRSKIQHINTKRDTNQGSVI
jgi:hypothetical protein